MSLRNAYKAINVVIGTVNVIVVMVRVGVVVVLIVEEVVVAVEGVVMVLIVEGVVVVMVGVGFVWYVVIALGVVIMITVVKASGFFLYIFLVVFTISCASLSDGSKANKGIGVEAVKTSGLVPQTILLIELKILTETSLTSSNMFLYFLEK